MALFGGVGTGKTFTGSHFAIRMMTEHPELTGLIGANTYDQLSQATVFELMYWLDLYGFEYVTDRRPPKEWGKRKPLKRYDNTISVRVGDRVATAFTRVMSAPNPLRGVEISWYWMDETRDTPQNTHEVIIARLRESDEVHRGLITTTTNGEDWGYRAFVRNADGKLFNALHVKTMTAVQLGILTQHYYDTMKRLYSPLMAAQELEAQHVNVLGGQAYHAWGQYNQAIVAPWGDAVPDRRRPLIVGCDFNFSPAPLVWEVGQLSPDGESIHWFNELSQVACSTETMTQRLISEFPGYSFEVYGDASGGKGTTSNAGEHDYSIMARVFRQAGVWFSIHYDQANPLVKNRVENINAKLCNFVGETRMTYNPDACPLLDEDFRQVGWTLNGKLDDGGIVTRTHATDGVGYATWILLPFGEMAGLPETVHTLASTTGY